MSGLKWQIRMIMLRKMICSEITKMQFKKLVNCQIMVFFLMLIEMVQDTTEMGYPFPYYRITHKLIQNNIEEQE